MLAKKFCLVLTVIATLSFALICHLENSAQAAGRDRMYPKARNTFDRKKIIENIREQDPEVIRMMQNLRGRQAEARRLANQYDNQMSEEQKIDIENRLRFITEEIVRNQFIITERTLDHLAEKYENLRARHQKNKARFDDIVEQRLRNLLRLP